MSDNVLNAQQFLDALDIKIEKVPTPEMGKDTCVFVRSLTAGQRSKIDGIAAKFKVSDGKNVGEIAEFNINLVFWGACDSKGERLFNDVRQIDALKKKNAAVISRIAEAVARLSGLSKEDLEQLEKNSPQIQPEDSPSA